MDRTDHVVRLDALDELWRVWSEFGASLTEQQWSLPTRCPGWDVRAVYAHYSLFPVALATPPDLPESPTAEPVTAAEVLRGFNAPGGVATTEAGTVADAAVTDSTRHSTAELIDLFRAQGPRTLDTLRRADGATVVPWVSAENLMPLDEVLRIVLMEGTVHLLDVKRALDSRPDVPPAALEITTHLLAEMAPAVELVEAATGRSADSPLPVLR